MNSFVYRDNQLCAEAVPLTRIAEQFGTPCYVYSRSKLEAQYLAYQEAFGDLPHLICYAVKANPNLAVLNVLAQLGAGFDIVSGGELARVIAAGGDPQKVVFSGVGKTAAEMQQALDADILCFNVESAQELERLNEIAQAAGKTAAISLRVNPDVDASTHPYISTGLKDSKFGVDIGDALPLYRRAREMRGIRITGMDCHIGSQLTSLDPFLDTTDRLLALVGKLADEGITLEHVDLGGGLGVAYGDEAAPTPAEYTQTLTRHLGAQPFSYIIEPGRSICAEAGLLLTRVEYLKHGPDKNFAIVDAAMNDLIRPALYQAWMEISPVMKNGPDDVDLPARTYDIVGPVCESADFLGKDRHLSLSQGDLLAVHTAGAYGFTMSSNYNTRNRAAEIMVDGERMYQVRRRETYDDQFRLETVIAE